jgi:uncharacterized membrane protein YeaQ/YmgE (transglycosylase-associated protein family)
MIGMSFLSFLVLLGIGAIVAAVFHFGLRYRILEGFDAFFAKVVLGWVGAWLGSPIFGYWSYRVGNLYLVPAILGAITAVVLNVVAWKAVAKVFASQPTAEKGIPGFSKAA